MSEPHFSDKVFCVIGGTSGMGLSAVKALLSRDARVVFSGKDREEVATLRGLLGPAVLGVLGDATDPGSAELVVQKGIEAFGRLDGLYHVAGGSGRRMGDGPLHDITDEGWDYTLRLNLSSVFYSNRAAIRAFLGQGRGGVILNMASVLAYSPSAANFATHAYTAAKAGIIGMSRAAAARYAPNNIRVNVIAPGLMETPMSRRAVQDESIMRFVRSKQPLDSGRAGTPADVDEAVLYLLSDASRFVTGQVLAVDGGWSVTEGIA